MSMQDSLVVAIGLCDSDSVMAEASSRTCTFRRDTRGFVHAVMKQGCEMALDDAKENVAAIYDLAGGRTLVLVDMRGVRWQSREARDYFASANAAEATKAVALIIGSPVSRVLGSFFLRMERHRFPTALFNDEDKAIRWLLEQHDD
jgi:hypothetical protein